MFQNPRSNNPLLQVPHFLDKDKGMSGSDNGPPLHLPYSGHHKAPHSNEPSKWEVKKRPKEKTQVRFPACPLCSDKLGCLSQPQSLHQQTVDNVTPSLGKPKEGVKDFLLQIPTRILTAKFRTSVLGEFSPRPQDSSLYPHPTLNMQVSHHLG